jgi:hypothetical protein
MSYASPPPFYRVNARPPRPGVAIAAAIGVTLAFAIISALIIGAFGRNSFYVVFFGAIAIVGTLDRLWCKRAAAPIAAVLSFISPYLGFCAGDVLHVMWHDGAPLSFFTSHLGWTISTASKDIGGLNYTLFVIAAIIAGVAMIGRARNPITAVAPTYGPNGQGGFGPQQSTGYWQNGPRPAGPNGQPNQPQPFNPQPGFTPQPFGQPQTGFPQQPQAPQYGMPQQQAQPFATPRQYAQPWQQPNPGTAPARPPSGQDTEGTTAIRPDQQGEAGGRS